MLAIRLGLPTVDGGNERWEESKGESLSVPHTECQLINAGHCWEEGWGLRWLFRRRVQDPLEG